MYLGTLRADSVRVQHKVCKLLGPVAHIQAPIFALGILILKILQFLHDSNVADKLLDNLTESRSTDVSAVGAKHQANRF